PPAATTGTSTSAPAGRCCCGPARPRSSATVSAPSTQHRSAWWSPRVPDRRRRAWNVVIPVKPAALGKSRLEIPGVDRIELARAIALDTIEAAAQVARVIVVTADPAMDLPGVELVIEPAPRGIAAAVADGLAVAPPERRAVLLGDL